MTERTLLEIVILMATIFFFLSTLLYSFTTWYKTIMGRGLFFVLSNFTLALILISSGYFTADAFVFRDAFRVVVYLLTLINGVTIFVAVVTLQFSGSRNVRADQRDA